MKKFCLMIGLLSILLFYGCDSIGLDNAYEKQQIPNVQTPTDDGLASSRIAGFSSDIAVYSDDFVNSFQCQSDASAMFLVNDTSNTILYALNPMAPVAPSQTAKLLTAYIVLQKCSLQDYVVISQDLSLPKEASGIYLKKGDTITVENLLYGMLIGAADDCAVALARHISGSEKKFAEIMNQTARSLGATRSVFYNSYGGVHKKQKSCAYDLYLILKKDMELIPFRKIIQKKKVTLSYYGQDMKKIKYSLKTTNGYLTDAVVAPQGIKVSGGILTTAEKSGSYAALAAQNKSGENIISIVLHASDQKVLYHTMTTLLSHSNEK